MDFMDAFILGSGALETIVGLNDSRKADAKARKDEEKLELQELRSNKIAEKSSAGGTI
jgi:hypothetical protein